MKFDNTVQEKNICVPTVSWLSMIYTYAFIFDINW